MRGGQGLGASLDVGRLLLCSLDGEHGYMGAANGRSLPPLTDGSYLELATLAQESAGVGGRVWTAACTMCEYLKQSAAPQLDGASVLELGSGTGACGIFAAALGARRVVLTDGGPKALLDLAVENAQANAVLLPDDACVDVCRLRWEEIQTRDDLIEAITGSERAVGDADESHAHQWEQEDGQRAGDTTPILDFDFILASDVTYDDDTHQDLCRVLRLLLSENEQVKSSPQRARKRDCWRCCCS
eukprot:scaffold228470_cov35-Tisochrysis_lutea.AAC.3